MPKVLNNAKEDILKVARDMLITEGYENMNVREISFRCGIGTGTLYNYFNSKQEIIISIISSDWDTMLRRIDCSNKTEINYMKKLQFIFNQINLFMKNVHNLWYQDFMDKSNITEVCKVQERRNELRKQLTEKIYASTDKQEDINNNLFLSDMIARIFLSYAKDGDGVFEDLKPYIIRLLN